jgi:hypothetical protein
VLNFWYRALSERNGIVSTDLNLRKTVRRYAEAGKGVWRTRAQKFDLAIQNPAKHLPVRVIFNDGRLARISVSTQLPQTSIEIQRIRRYKHDEMRSPLLGSSGKHGHPKEAFNLREVSESRFLNQSTIVSANDRFLTISMMVGSCWIITWVRSLQRSCVR